MKFLTHAPGTSGADRLRQRLIAAWRGDRPLEPPWNWLLAGAAAAYGGGECLSRRWRRPRRVPGCTVISVGNLTVGGTGKTPFCAYLAHRLTTMGRRVAIISRGYRGGLEKTGGVVSDGTRILADAAAAGDEPLMLAAQLPEIPLLVGHHRYRSLQRAVHEFHAQVAILDDGFQHIQVQRDLDLVLMDGRAPLGNGRLLPAGPLREPSRRLQRAHGLILMGDSAPPRPNLPEALLRLKLPLFQASRRAVLRGVVPARQGPGLTILRQSAGQIHPLLRQKKIFGFSGIAGNAGFRQTLAESGGRLVGFSDFRDHHMYSPAELNQIQNAARNCAADLIATTEKDYVRFAELGPWPLDLAVMGLEIRVHPNHGLDALLAACLAGKGPFR